MSSSGAYVNCVIGQNRNVCCFCNWTKIKIKTKNLVPKFFPKRRNQNLYIKRNVLYVLYILLQIEIVQKLVTVVSSKLIKTV